MNEEKVDLETSFLFLREKSKIFDEQLKTSQHKPKKENKFNDTNTKERTKEEPGMMVLLFW